MSRLLRMIFLFAAIGLIWGLGVDGQKRDYGPAVSSYLLGLDEDFKELDFQLRHGEISRSDYTRARQRLLILRRAIERRASERAEDLVPELEVVTADEFGTLGSGVKLDADGLQVGSLVGERWKLVSIESGRPRFFVFERLRRPETRGGDEALNKTVDPRTVIETITVEDRAAPPTPPTPAPSSASEANLPAPPPEPQQAPREMRLDGPRILRFYLPAYSKEALAKGVEGELVVSALFRHDGKIKEVVVNQGLGYGLDERALDAVRRTEFEPARRDERPIDIRAEIVFNFSLMKVTVRVRNVDESTDTKRSLR